MPVTIRAPLLTWFWPWLALVAVSDLISKRLVFGAVSPQAPGDDMQVLRELTVHWYPEWPWILPSFNKGVAWSMFHQWPNLVAALTLFLIPVLGWVFWRWFRLGSRLEVLAFGLVLGGALGNGWDRLLALMPERTAVHGVRDFIHVDLGFWPCDPWPTFNIADSGITGGFIALLLSMWLTRTPQAPKEPPSTTNP